MAKKTIRYTGGGGNSGSSGGTSVTITKEPPKGSSGGSTPKDGSFRYKADYSNVPDIYNPKKNPGGKFANDADFAKANIINSFLSFGYEPSEEEVSQLITTSGGTGGGERGQSMVANYVSAKRAAEERQANDPLKGFSESQAALAESQRTESADLFQQAMDVYKAAPQLFGGLNPDQIQQYLAPITESARLGLADTEGAFGRRGLLGSSIEANAMAEQQRLYQQNVLATALQLGLEQQGNVANLLTGRSNQLLGAAEGASGRQGGALGQLSGQAFEESQFIASLPLYLRELAMQERAMMQGGQKNWAGNILSGALSGAAAGSAAGPWGALAGGVAGAGLGAAGTAAGADSAPGAVAGYGGTALANLYNYRRGGGANLLGSQPRLAYGAV